MDADVAPDLRRELGVGLRKSSAKSSMYPSITKLCLVCFETKCGCGQKRRKAAQKTKAQPKRKDLLPSPVALQIVTADPKQLRGQLVYSVEELRLRWSWVALIPARLGVNPAVDSAALSLCQIHQHRALGQHHAPSLDAALHSYSKTLKLLRKAVAKPDTALLDSTLATVALVALFETIIKHCPGTRVENVFSHWSGIEAILSARKGQQHCSELTRSIIYNMYDCTLGVPVSLGRISPFECGEWMHMKPAAIDVLPDDIQALQHSTLYTCTLTPRLIIYVRKLREGNPDSEHMKRTVELLRHLLTECREDEAENSVLHSIKIVKNADPEDAITGTFAFNFDSLTQYRAAILYWSIRLGLMNVYFIVQPIVPPDLLTQLPDAERLRQDQTRWMANLVMSWPYARRQGSFAQTDMAQGCLTLWQALKGREGFKGRKMEEWRKWMLPKMMMPFSGWVAEVRNEEEVDVASELLAGGPLTGFMRTAAVQQ